MRAVDVALTQVGVRELGGRNRGPEVDEYIRRVGLNPEKGSYAWCSAFVGWCVSEAAHRRMAAKGEQGPPKLPLEISPGVFDMWRRNPRERRDRDKPAPGYVFVIDYGVKMDGGRRGHTGFVVSVLPGGIIETVEGNTNLAGSREGDGVYRRTRKAKEIYGYLDPEAWYNVA